MKVIGICGSPRKGNSEWMVETALKELEKNGIETELFYLRKLNIKGCDGCLVCETTRTEREGKCPKQDDMQSLFPRLLAADGFVFGTPVYFEMASGLLKTFMDRTCAIWPNLKGKKAVGIAVAEEGCGKAIDNIKTYCKVCSIDYIGSVTTLAKTPHDAAKDRTLAKRLAWLAKKLAAELKA